VGSAVHDINGTVTIVLQLRGCTMSAERQHEHHTIMHIMRQLDPPLKCCQASTLHHITPGCGRLPRWSGPWCDPAAPPSTAPCRAGGSGGEPRTTELSVFTQTMERWQTHNSHTGALHIAIAANSWWVQFNGSVLSAAGLLTCRVRVSFRNWSMCAVTSRLAPLWLSGLQSARINPEAA
jgi:hypothetical protein